MEMKKMKKICVVCGKEFEYTGLNPKQIGICSKDCRKKRNVERLHKFYEKHPEKKAEYSEAAFYRYCPDGMIHCKICGQPIYRNDRTDKMQMHDTCIYDDCIRTLQQHKTLTNQQYNRLRLRGYTLATFREDYADELE